MKPTLTPCLFDLGATPQPQGPFQPHSKTSKAAAVEVPNAETMRRAVLDVLLEYPAGLTDERMQQMLFMRANTQRPRRVELVAGGFVMDSGTMRPTESGRAATVWVATEKGRKVK